MVLPQPDNSTCGPTCLHAVYRYWGDDIELGQVIAEIDPLPEGGTLAVTLACHALRRGYRAEIYSYNLQLFDPTWFTRELDLSERLREQKKRKPGHKLGLATDAYLELLELGGAVRFHELEVGLLRAFLDHEMPILTGLSATYLYACARERGEHYDDVSGDPTGHFVVVSGYDAASREVFIADPLRENPRFADYYYRIGVDRLIAAILLGIVTYDANLLIVAPRTEPWPF